MSFTFEAPPAIVWEWITSPARRLQWQIGVDALSEDVAGGRRGVGTTNHCVHGRDAIVEEVLAWHPPEVLTTRFQMPMPGVPKLTRSELFEATPDGAKTLFTVRVQRPSSAKDRAKLAEVKSFLFHAYGDGLALLAPMIEADVAARSDPAVQNLNCRFRPGGTSLHGREGRPSRVARRHRRRRQTAHCVSTASVTASQSLPVSTVAIPRSRASRLGPPSDRFACCPC